MKKFNVRANCVCPVPVRTKLTMAVHSQDIIDAYHDAIPLNRYGSENEIAELITFLCSSKASYITRQVIAADGGFESTELVYPRCERLTDTQTIQGDLGSLGQLKKAGFEFEVISKSSKIHYSCRFQVNLTERMTLWTAGLPIWRQLRELFSKLQG